MKKIKMTICLALVFVLCCANLTVYAQEKVPTGRVMVSIQMTEEEGIAYKESMILAVERATASLKDEMAMTTDEDKKVFLLSQIEASAAIDYDQIFQQNADGSYHIDIPYLYGQISIDGKMYSTDINGCYYADNAISTFSALDESSIAIYKDNCLVATSKDFELNEANGDIVITRTLSELGAGIQRMGEGMQAAEGQVTIVTYPKKSVNDYYGNGVGRSKIWRDTNIVGCNKHDTNTDSITTVEFALQSSDCSTSVKLGIAYAASPLLLSSYWMSANCVAEAISSDDGLENPYCNGKLKDGKTNCSWFTGIGHTESFHTHIW